MSDANTESTPPVENDNTGSTSGEETVVENLLQDREPSGTRLPFCTESATTSARASLSLVPFRGTRGDFCDVLPQSYHRISCSNSELICAITGIDGHLDGSPSDACLCGSVRHIGGSPSDACLCGSIRSQRSCVSTSTTESSCRICQMNAEETGKLIGLGVLVCKGDIVLDFSHAPRRNTDRDYQRTF